MKERIYRGSTYQLRRTNTNNIDWNKLDKAKIEAIVYLESHKVYAECYGDWVVTSTEVSVGYGPFGFCALYSHTGNLYIVDGNLDQYRKD